MAGGQVSWEVHPFGRAMVYKVFERWWESMDRMLVERRLFEAGGAGILNTVVAPIVVGPFLELEAGGSEGDSPF